MQRKRALNMQNQMATKIFISQKITQMNNKHNILDKIVIINLLIIKSLFLHQIMSMLNKLLIKRNNCFKQQIQGFYKKCKAIRMTNLRHL